MKALRALIDDRGPCSWCFASWNNKSALTGGPEPKGNRITPLHLATKPVVSTNTDDFRDVRKP